MPSFVGDKNTNDRVPHGTLHGSGGLVTMHAIVITTCLPLESFQLQKFVPDMWYLVLKCGSNWRRKRQERWARGLVYTPERGTVRRR